MSSAKGNRRWRAILFPRTPPAAQRAGRPGGPLSFALPSLPWLFVDSPVPVAQRRRDRPLIWTQPANQQSLPGPAIHTLRPRLLQHPVHTRQQPGRTGGFIHDASGLDGRTQTEVIGAAGQEDQGRTVFILEE